MEWVFTSLHRFISGMSVSAVGVILCVCSLPESCSCFPGRPQSVPRGSSCQPSGTSPGPELSPRNGSPGPPPQPTCDPQHIICNGPFPTNPLLTVHKQLPTHRLLVVSVVSGGGRALLSPWPPSWAGESGSTRWNSNGVRFCVRYTTWPLPAIRQTDKEMDGEERAWAEGMLKGGCQLKRGKAKGGNG